MVIAWLIPVAELAENNRDDQKDRLSRAAKYGDFRADRIGDAGAHVAGPRGVGCLMTG
jgi:hypothetical protein